MSDYGENFLHHNRSVYQKSVANRRRTLLNQILGAGDEARTRDLNLGNALLEIWIKPFLSVIHRLDRIIAEQYRS
jgi:hypothetical protein